MRPARIRGAFTYHCMSRIAGGEHLLGDAEKEVLRNLMWRVRDFCGVRILTYCLMSNHFHVLVDV
ncbi:MAG: transposase, partial [Opitutales bacterium]